MEILTESGVNPAGKPFVTIRVTGGEGGQLSPQETRAFAMAFLEAAEAAESDAIVFALLHHELDLDVERTALILADTRRLRGAIRDRWEAEGG